MAKDFCLCHLRKLLPKLFREHGSSYQNHHRDYAEDARPSPSLVPVPKVNHTCIPSLIKASLPVVEFSRSKWQDGLGEQSAVCAICLACIKGSEEIRELGNCSHLYHMDCIDRWVDQGHGTLCPLCRLDLLPCEAFDEDAKGENDPWRRERIPSLFGEIDL